MECCGLAKRYGHQQALDGLDMEVGQGTLFGLLGPNGAGKSTTLRILSGLVRSNRGRARLFGTDVRRHTRATARTAFLIENAVFPPHLTARQALRRVARFAGLPYDETPLERVGMTYARNRKAGGYSHGMRQRLGLACALLGSPDLLVLDEPQNGLDPEGLRTIRTILREEHARGATVLVSVHRLAEVEGLCTHAAILVAGKAVRQGAVSELLRTDSPRYRIETGDPISALKAIREALPALTCVQADGALLLSGDRDAAAAAAAACVRRGIDIYELSAVRRTLDELYLSEVSR